VWPWRRPQPLTRSKRAARRNDIRQAITVATALLTAGAVIVALSQSSRPELAIALYMNDDCGHCQRYADYLRSRRFHVEVRPETELPRLHASHRWPRGIRARPVGIIDGYFVMGHVPTEDIRNFIANRRDELGLVLPGLPAGAPGIRSALPTQFTVYSVRPGGLMEPLHTYNHAPHFW
jgi:hypothetical protein